MDCNLVPAQKRLLLELLPEVLPFLKDGIKESSIDKSDECDEFSAASARVPVGFAILAAHQLRWFITQVLVFDSFFFFMCYVYSEMLGFELCCHRLIILI